VQVGNREDKTERVNVTITIQVVSVEYAGDSECRCKGRCVSENAYIEMGAFHTISLKPQTPITINKTCWDRLDIARLQEASDPAAGADLAVVLVTDGLAHVCLIGRSATLLQAKVRHCNPCLDPAWLCSSCLQSLDVFKCILQCSFRLVLLARIYAVPCSDTFDI
jgi:stalled ribosome rescue protein Dom34